MIGLNGDDAVTVCVCFISAELFSSSPADEVTALVCGAFECSVH